MPTYAEITTQIADQWIAALENTEKIVTAASERGRRLAESVPQPAPIKIDAFDKLADLSPVTLPSPTEVVSANFDLATRVLNAQRESTLRLIDALVPAAKAPTGTVDA